MLERRCVTYLLLAACCAAGAPQASPAELSARDLLPAHVAVFYDLNARCPGIRQGLPDDEGVAVVAFQVSPTGVPSQAALITSSGSGDLDSAAVTCVTQLRFQPAVSRGDGTAVASRQVVAWKWARPNEHRAAAAAPASPPVSAPPASPPAVSPPVPAPATASRQAAGAAVRVCVDGSGRLAGDPTLVKSSGDAAFDHAALDVARSGSGSYRPLAGCLDLSISPE